MWSKIKSYIKSLISKMSFKDVLIIILLIASVILLILMNHYKSKSITPKIVANDSLETIVTKQGDTLIGKNTYVQTISDLKKSNDELYQQLKQLTDLKFQPIIVSNTETKLKIDTIYTEKQDTPIIDKDTIKILQWKSPANQYYSFNGTTLVRTDFSNFRTTISNFQVNSNLKVNLVEKDKQLKVVVSSDNPYIDVSNVNSVVIDPTKSKVLKSYFPTKRWHIGPYVGVGFDKKLKVTPSVGISIGYGIINF